MMLLSCIFSVAFSVCGVAAGWVFDLPVGAMTVIVAGVVFLVISALKWRVS
jgi:zinc transport system permease protein